MVVAGVPTPNMWVGIVPFVVGAVFAAANSDMKKVLTSSPIKKVIDVFDNMFVPFLSKLDFEVWFNANTFCSVY